MGEMGVSVAGNDIEIEIGKQVRFLRIENDMDQVQLAQAAGISLGAIKNIENGNGSSVKTLVSVAKALKATAWFSMLAPMGAYSLSTEPKETPGEDRQRVFRTKNRLPAAAKPSH